MSTAHFPLHNWLSMNNPSFHWELVQTVEVGEGQTKICLLVNHKVALWLLNRPKFTLNVYKDSTECTLWG